MEERKKGTWGFGNEVLPGGQGRGHAFCVGKMVAHTGIGWLVSVVVRDHVVCGYIPCSNIQMHCHSGSFVYMMMSGRKISAVFGNLMTCYVACRTTQGAL